MATLKKSKFTIFNYIFTIHLWVIWYSSWWRVFVWMIWKAISTLSSIITTNILLWCWSVLIVSWKIIRLTSKWDWSSRKWNWWLIKIIFLIIAIPILFASFKLFYFDRIWDEVRAKAKNELLHSIFMSKLVYADSSDVPVIDEISPETFSHDKPLPKEVFHRWQLILEIFKNNNFLWSTKIYICRLLQTRWLVVREISHMSKNLLFRQLVNIFLFCYDKNVNERSTKRWNFIIITSHLLTNTNIRLECRNVNNQIFHCVAYLLSSYFLKYIFWLAYLYYAFFYGLNLVLTYCVLCTYCWLMCRIFGLVRSEAHMISFAHFLVLI